MCMINNNITHKTNWRLEARLGSPFYFVSAIIGVVPFPFDDTLKYHTIAIYHQSSGIFPEENI